MRPPEDNTLAPMFNMGLYVKNFQLVFKQNYSSQLKKNYIFVIMPQPTLSFGDFFYAKSTGSIEKLL
jgi:hypothetical protein